MLQKVTKCPKMSHISPMGDFEVPVMEL